jgi:2-polyprenyl-3-methyl-5-hydroxy-6-metoxy-1,4-benzoquinol methylase
MLAERVSIRFTMSDAPPGYYYDHKRLEMLPFVPSTAKRILDVGCGAGAFASELARRVPAEFWGIELNAATVARASTVFHRIITGDAYLVAVELPDHYFDCIICNDVLEHVVEPIALLEKLRGKLAPGGIIVASVPNVRYVKNLYHLLAQKDWEYQDEGIRDRTHLRFFTRRSMTRSLTSAGWRILRCHGILPTRMRAAFAVLNALTLGSIADTQFMNFAFVFTSAH